MAVNPQHCLAITAQSYKLYEARTDLHLRQTVLNVRGSSQFQQVSKDTHRLSQSTSLLIDDQVGLDNNNGYQRTTWMRNEAIVILNLCHFKTHSSFILMILVAYFLGFGSQIKCSNSLYNP